MNMVNFSKKLLLLLVCLCMAPVAVAKKVKKTKKLQLLVVPSDPSFMFALNAGNGIITNPNTPRPQGSYYATTALIFPGGTVGKNQSDFSVDKHGNPINFNDNLGVAYVKDTMIRGLVFTNVPPVGTLIEQAAWSFHFKHSCDGGNDIYAMGLAKVGNFPAQSGKSIYDLAFGVTGGSGCNRTIDKNSFKAKVYLSQTGPVVSLVKVKFKKEIEYKN
jgi:hypothetical protein